MNEITSNQNDVYATIKDILAAAREKAYKAINFAMVEAYWNVGRLIVAEQAGNERADYGDLLIKRISEKLTQEFGKGFTITNLKYMRQFYLAFQKGHTLCDQLSWSHYRLLSRIDSEDSRSFYLKECVDGNWSVRQLERQINSFYYQRLLASQNKDLIRNEIHSLEKDNDYRDFIKDPFVLEFTGIKDPRDFSEIELEKGLMDNIQDFLLELGKGFSFVARQKRITAEGDHFFIDLVFYNFILKCFVLIDLKVGKLSHQDIGQMDFYVRYYEKEMKTDTDNPTIGIILCSERNETVVKYSMLEDSKQIFSAKYLPYLPTEEELKKEIKRERNLLEMEAKLAKEEEASEE